MISVSMKLGNKNRVALSDVKKFIVKAFSCFELYW